MKINELLNEASMSPTSLRSASIKAGALCGVEFEMCVNADLRKEKKGSNDPYPASSKTIIDFFTNQDNPPDKVKEVVSNFWDEFEDFSFEAYKERVGINKFKKDKTSSLAHVELVRNYLASKGAPSDLANEVLEFYKLIKSRAAELATLSTNERIKFLNDKRKFFQSDEGFELYRSTKDAIDELWDSQIKEWWNEGRTGSHVKNMARDWAMFYEDELWKQFLASKQINTMSDFHAYIGVDKLSWPDQSQTETLESLADKFSEVIGLKTSASHEYHGAGRSADTWAIEPDSSIICDGSDTGLEFVSPPLPLEEMLASMKKVIDWANARGYYTNKSTGLHMNISLPKVEYSKIDKIKLVLFLGDKYVLEQFGRSANDYCKSAYERIATDSILAVGALNMLSRSLERSVERINFSQSKYMSVNPHDSSKYIEFRSPGGDWLKIDFDKLANTMRRFVTAMAIAADPNAYRNEYMKKLYKLLEPSGVEQFTTLFAKYQAGLISREDLQTRLTR